MEHTQGLGGVSPSQATDQAGPLGTPGILRVLLLERAGARIGEPLGPQEGYVQTHKWASSWSNFHRILASHRVLCALRPVASPL